MLVKNKHFLIGMLMGLVPVLFYANFKLEFINLSDQHNKLLFENQTLSTYKNSFTNIEKQTPSSEYQLASIIEYSYDKESPHDEVVTVKPTKIPSPTPTEVVLITVPESEFDVIIEKYAGSSGVDSRVMKVIAKCESGYRPDAVNGPYGGMYQFISTTWISNRRAMGEDPNTELRFNAEEAIKTAAFKMSRDGFSAWPKCGQIALSQVFDK